jgi:hypothetical protein
MSREVDFSMTLTYPSACSKNKWFRTELPPIFSAPLKVPRHDMNFRLRVGLATLTIVATGVLYAEGVLKTGWIEAALCIPIGLSLIATGSLSRVLQNVLLSITAISLSLTTSDLILRPTFGHRLHYTPTNISNHKLPELPIVGRWDPDQTLDTESYGDLAAIAGDPALQERRRIVFRTDEFGFRNIPASEATDVLILGDSFAAGVGTTGEETFARLLESTYGFHTYNLSYPGGPYDQFVNFAIEWPRLNVASPRRMIWTFFTGNDLDDAGGETWDISNLPWKHGFSAWLVKCRTYRNRSPLNQWMEAVRMKFWGKPATVIVRSLPDGQPVLFFGGYEEWGKRSRHEVEQHPNFEKLKRTLAAMRALTAERNVELTILILPTKGEVYRWLLETREPQPDDSNSSGFALAVLEACKNASIVCHDTKPYMVSEAKQLFDTEGKLLWWRDDTHIGKYGHAAIAAYIADSVLNN